MKSIAVHSTRTVCLLAEWMHTYSCGILELVDMYRNLTTIQYVLLSQFF